LRHVLSFSWRQIREAQNATAARERRPWRRPSRAGICALMTVCSLFCALPPPAGATGKPTPGIKADNTRKELPKGPLQIVISIDQQKLHLYSDGMLVADAPIATGVADHPTPLGIFSIIQKSRDHRSNIYSNAPMPFMERLTWSGVALHEGFNLGHPASHGCIRMSHEFAVRLWGLTKLDARVVIARPELRPADISDPHLFVHKEKPTDADPAASLAPATPSMPTLPMPKLLKTAETMDGSQTIDISGRHSRDPAAAAGEPAQTAPAQTAPTDGQKVVSLPKAEEAAHTAKKPIAIFISGKTKKIYVRQNFLPLFEADVEIEGPGRPLGTHVFTAMEYLDDGTSFRWNVISLPGAQPPPARRAVYVYENKLGAGRREGRIQRYWPGPPEAPEQALARIGIPQEAIDQISELIVPGSSLIISDQGLGEETGEGTNFIVVTR
jgi:hypothetical protein